MGWSIGMVDQNWFSRNQTQNVCCHGSFSLRFFRINFITKNLDQFRHLRGNLWIGIGHRNLNYFLKQKMTHRYDLESVVRQTHLDVFLPYFFREIESHQVEISQEKVFRIVKIHDDEEIRASLIDNGHLIPYLLVVYHFIRQRRFKPKYKQIAIRFQSRAVIFINNPYWNFVSPYSVVIDIENVRDPITSVLEETRKENRFSSKFWMISGLALSLLCVMVYDKFH